MKLIVLLAGILSCYTLLVTTGSALAGNSHPKLTDTQDTELQTGLEDLIREKKLVSFINEQKLAIAIADISDPNHPRFAKLNGDHMMYAASLPKLAILVAAFLEIQRGLLELDSTLWDDMNAMIRHSDNAAATRVLERAGKENLLAILQEQKFNFYNKNEGGGLWVGKAYSSSPAYARDPLNNLSHGATATQVARVYYLLATGQLLNQELSSKMLEILSDPAINHKLVKGLKGSHPNARLYRKSGTWKNFHADSAMVEDDNNRYILVILADHANGGDWIADLASPLMQLMEKQTGNK